MKEPVEFDLTLGKTVANTDRTGLIGNVLVAAACLYTG